MSTDDSDLEGSDEYGEIPLSVIAFTVEQTAVNFGVAVSTIRRLLAENKLPKLKSSVGNVVVIPRHMNDLGYRRLNLSAIDYSERLAECALVEGQEPDKGRVSATVGWGIGRMKQGYQRKLDEQQQRHDELLADIKAQHQAEVEQLIKRADDARKLARAIYEMYKVQRLDRQVDEI